VETFSACGEDGGYVAGVAAPVSVAGVVCSGIVADTDVVDGVWNTGGACNPVAGVCNGVDRNLAITHAQGGG
jgi:hypothetical protein